MATKVNGLRGLEIPWHLKATWEAFGPDGKSSDKGTFEEWHISAQKYHLALRSPAISVDKFSTEEGMFRTGGEWPRLPLSAIQTLIESPVVVSEQPDKVTLENYERTMGGIKSPCTAIRYPQGERDRAHTFCFAPNDAIVVLDLGVNNTFQTLFQNVSKVHEQYFARDIQRLIMGKPFLTLHLDSLEGMSPSVVSAFAVPAGATAMPLRAHSPADVWVNPTPITRVTPVYPPEAKWKHIEGQVMVNGIIGTDGHFKDLKALSGPSELQAAALEAAQKWVYSPALLNGKPIETELTLTLMFRMAR